MRFPMTHYEWMKRNGINFITDELFKKFGKSYYLSFEEFANWVENSPILLNFLSGSTLNNTNLFARQIYHCYKMELNGEKIYYMNREVCNLLKNTRLTIDAEFIESPFEQIYIYTDQNDITISDNTGIMPMRGIYIQLTKENDNKFLRFIVTSGVEGIDQHLDVNYFATFTIPEHGDLETIANINMDKIIKERTVLNSDVNLTIMRKIFVFSVNALLYIGCKNVDFINFTPENLNESLLRKKNNAKKVKLERMIAKTAQIPFIIVNPKKGESDNEGIKNMGKKLDHQIFVSGHWRGQWSGTDNNRKKEIIRIKSYLKGIGLKEETSKPFLVK
jgi:hypothetical protein